VREPVSQCREIETIAACLEKSLTRFSTKAERHIIALGITTTPWHRQAHAHKDWDQKVHCDELSPMKHAASPLG
jgi:hypothetical protein